MQNRPWIRRDYGSQEGKESRCDRKAQGRVPYRGGGGRLRTLTRKLRILQSRCGDACKKSSGLREVDMLADAILLGGTDGRDAWNM